jgi:hypothetical protein
MKRLFVLAMLFIGVAPFIFNVQGSSLSTEKLTGTKHMSSSHISSVASLQNVESRDAFLETDIRVEKGSIRHTHRSGVVHRDMPDTLVYEPVSGSFGGQFIQSPGDAMMMLYQMPADGYITGVNVPVYEWGTGDQQLTVSLHRVTYPYRTDGTMYPSVVVDGNGWIGGYDMDASGWMSIAGTTYSPGGTQGICDPGDYVANGAQDPLGDSLGVGQGVSLMGLVWPDSTIAATLDPANSPIQQDNWLNTADYGSQPFFHEGEWVGVLVAFTGSGGGDDPATGFYYADGAGAVDPWAFTKFYAGCEGTSGNGGWHIRHWIIDFELAVMLTGDRAPIFVELPDLPTTTGTSDRPISTIVSDDNPSGGTSGVAAVTFYFQLDSIGAPLDSITLALTSGTSDYGTWTGTMPGQSPGTYVYWYLKATDVNGNTTTTATNFYYIFQPTAPYLFLYNASDYGSWISTYYLYNTGLNVDVWSVADYGPPPTTLLSVYDMVIEVTGSGPVEILNDSIRTWHAQGAKRYILTGDEWLGAQTGWVNQTYFPGDFQYDVLGIASDFNDVNYYNAGDQWGISRMEAISNNPISGELYTFLSDSGLYLNYNPYYELGFSNWMDGVTPIAGANAAFRVYEGTVPDMSSPDPTTTLYDCGIYYTTSYASKSVFLSFDPLSTDADNANGTGYVWVGIQAFGPLQKSVNWILSDIMPPVLSVTPSDTLDFGNVFIGQTLTDSATIENIGSQVLEIYSITSNSNDFIVLNAPTDTVLLFGGEHYAVRVAITPSLQQTYSGTLTITSNDLTNPTYTLEMTAIAVNPPAIVVTPDSLFADLFTGDTAVRILTIDNTNGGSDLDWFIGTAGGNGFYDDFDDGVADNWISADGNWWVSNGSYQVTNTNYTVSTSYYDNDFTNYEYEVKMRKTTGGSYNIGLILNGDPSQLDSYGDWYNCYWLAISASGDWVFFKEVNGSVITLQSWTYSADLFTGLGAWNVVKVVSANGYFDVYFNSVLQGTYVDSTFTSGKVGLKMYDYSYAGQAEYDYVSLTPLTDGYTFGPAHRGGYRNEVTLNNNERSKVAKKRHIVDGEISLDTGREVSRSSLSEGNYIFNRVSRDNWLSFLPGSGTVTAGTSMDVTVTFNAADMFGGDYNDDIIITSNDPVTPEVIVPAHLHVTGVPDIALGGGEYDSTSTIYWYTSDATTTHEFNTTYPPSGDGTLTVTVDGDYNSSSEYADVYVEGTLLATINPTVTGPTTESYTLPMVDLVGYASDGLVTVVVDNSPAVNPGYGADLHTVQLTYPMGSGDSLQFGGVFIGDTSIIAMSVFNIGTDLLVVSSIQSSIADFNVEVDSFSIDPGLVYLLRVLFTPTSEGYQAGTLTITSNDPDEPVLDIVMEGTGLLPPVIAVVPDSLFADLYTGDTLDQSLTIDNSSGGSDLIFDITIEATGDSSGSQFFDLISMSITEVAIEGEEVPTGLNLKSGGKRKISHNAGNTFARRVQARLADLSGMNIGITDPYSVYGVIISDLEARGATVINVYFPLNSSLLDTLDVLAIDDNVSNASTTDIDLIRTWVQSGGGLLLQGDDNSSMSNINALLAGSGIEESAYGDYLDGTFTDIYAHPTTVDVDTVYGGSFGSYCSSVTAPAGIVVIDTIGNPHAAASVLGAGKVMAVGNEISHEYNFSVGDTRLFANQIFDWLAGRNVANWLTVAPATGIVPAGSSMVVDVEFDATDMFGGDYYADIVVASNDPVTPEIVVPAHLHVTGAPDIAISVDTLDYGTTFVGYGGMDSLVITNGGTDVLIVSNVASNNTDYTVDTTNFTLNPGESQTLRVTFLPVNVGLSSGILTIISNDPVDSTLTIVLEGEGVLPPVIGVNPDSLFADLFTGDTTVQILTIDNTNGSSDLVFTISISGGQTNNADISQPVINNPRVHSRSGITLGKMMLKTPLLSDRSGVRKQQRGLRRSAVPSVPPSHATETAVSREVAFFDGFEDGIWDDTWTLMSTGYTVEVTSDYAANGVYSLHLSGYSSPSHFYGLRTDFAPVQADYVSFYTRPDLLRDRASNYFVIGDENSQSNIGVIFFLAHGSEYMLFDGNGSHTYPFVNATWSFIEFRNIDWSTRTFDWYVDGNLADSNIPFRSQSSTYFSQINLYHWTDSTESSDSWYDYIYVGDYDSYPSVSWLTVAPISGVVPAGTSLDIEATFNAMGMFGGDYYADIVVASNDPVTPEVIVPAHLHVTGVPDIVLGGGEYDSTSTINWYTSDAITTHEFSTLYPPNGDGTLTVTIDGDYNSSSEYADVYIDGTLLATINPTVTGPTTESYTLPMVDLVGYASDGLVTVVVDNSPAVDPGYGADLHTVQLTYPMGSGDSLQFGPVYVGYSRNMVLGIANLGTDTLIINDITIDEPAFSSDITSLILLPQTNQPVIVTFAPVAETQYTGTLTVSSNDPDEPVITVTLNGEGANAPQIAVSPDSILEIVPLGGLSTRTLTVSNNGGSDLTFSIIVEEGSGRYLQRNILKHVQPGRQNRQITLKPSSTSMREWKPEIRPMSSKPMPGDVWEIPKIEIGKGEEDTRIYPRFERDTGGPDAFGYQWKDSNEPNGPTFDWIDASSGTDIYLSDDDFITGIPLGFTFVYYDSSYSSVGIGSNGWLSFNGVDGWYPSNVPYIDGHYGAIAPMARDLYPPSANYIRYLTTGTAPNRVFIVEYNSIPNFSGGNNKTFEVLFYEGSNKIRFQYLIAPDDPYGFGIESPDETMGLGNAGIDSTFISPTIVTDNYAIEFGVSFLDWLTLSTETGTIPASSSMDIGITLDGSIVEEGVYNALLKVTSNDPATPVVNVPVQMTVMEIQYPPTAFDLLTPANGELLTITQDNLSQATQFSWGASVDPNGTPVIYAFQGLGGLALFNYSGLTNNYFYLSHMAIRDTLQNHGLNMASGSWIVLAISAGDTTLATNGPFLLTIDASDILAINGSTLIPDKYALHQNYPNPFNPVTTIRYDLPEQSRVEIVIFDLLGQEVRTLVKATQEPGFKSVVWDGKDNRGLTLGSGVYLYRLTAGDYVKTDKMVLLR